MITIYRTSVTGHSKAEILQPYLDRLPGVSLWNFDFEDCDNILRIDSRIPVSQDIVNILNLLGFECEELD